IGLENNITGLIGQEVNTPFDLSKDYMCRARLIGISQVEHVLVIVMHHIASDGWSISIFTDELVEFYKSFRETRPVKLAALPIQYIDYAIWQNKYMTEDVLNKRMAYWINNLKGAEPLHLPTDHARPAIQSNNGALFIHRLDKT